MLKRIATIGTVLAAILLLANPAQATDEARWKSPTEVSQWLGKWCSGTVALSSTLFEQTCIAATDHFGGQPSSANWRSFTLFSVTGSGATHYVQVQLAQLQLQSNDGTGRITTTTFDLGGCPTTTLFSGTAVVCVSKFKNITNWPPPVTQKLRGLVRIGFDGVTTSTATPFQQLGF